MIITDYCMPEMTGYDLLKRVKVNNNPTVQKSKYPLTEAKTCILQESSLLKEIPVVVVSSENVPNRITRFKSLVYIK